MKKYLANAWSLRMLSGAACDVRVETLTLAQARDWAVDAESVVGHEDTAALVAELLGRPVACNRESVTLAPGDAVLVAQLDGPRLPVGATTLPAGAAFTWVLVTRPAAVAPSATSPRRQPDISVPFEHMTPAFRDQLTRQRDALGERLRMLVAIPSNDAVLAAAVASEAPHVLLLVTGKGLRAKGERYRDWLMANMVRPPSVRFLPEKDGEELTVDNLVWQVDGEVKRFPAQKVGLLVTTGTSVHTALLSHYAHVSGARALHVDVPYEGGVPRPDLPERGVQRLEVPAEVRERLHLREARELTHGGNFARARTLLAGRVTLGVLRDATLRWIDMLDAREALRLDEARQRRDELAAMLARFLDEEREQEDLRDLCVGCDAATKALVAYEDGSLAQAQHFAAEAFQRAEVEVQRGRLDLAALLYYRFAEAAVAARLRFACTPAIDPGNGLDHARADALSERFLEVARKLHGPKARGLVPRTPLGLVNGLIVLYLLDDAVVKGWGDHALDRIREIREVADSRNKSIFAHGFQPMDEAALRTWRSVVRREDQRGQDLWSLFAIGDARAWGETFSAHVTRR